MVGCVIVNDGAIVGEGFHQYDWRDHAEIVALKQAGRARTRRDALRHAGALQSHRAHRPVHRSDSDRRHHARGRGDGRSQSENSGRGFANACAPLASKSSPACCEGEARKLNEAVRSLDSHAQTIRHAEVRADARRPTGSAGIAQKAKSASMDYQSKNRAPKCIACATLPTRC